MSDGTGEHGAMRDQAIQPGGGGGSDPRTTKLRVKEYRTPSASRKHLSKLTKGLEKLCDQYRRYTQTTPGGRQELTLEFEEAGAYPGYHPEESAEESVKRFQRWVKSTTDGEEGWIHVLRVSDVESIAQGERVSWSTPEEYSHDTYACAVVNEADALAKLLGRNSEREILRAVHMHEVGHLLGASHSDGAQFHTRAGRVNSAMTFFYGTPIHIDKLDSVHEIPNVMDRYTHRCGDGRSEPVATWHLSTKLAGCALSKFDETIASYGPEGGFDEPNQSPEPSFTVSPSSPTAREDVTLDASSSRDPDGEIVRYEWEVEMADDTLASSDSTRPTFDVSFPISGTYTVVLTVTDDRGDSATSVQSVVVE
jgi:hypothetical protein